MDFRPIYHVDAFTEHAFGGNPAAVVLLDPDDDPSDTWMQAVAAEMALSETAFAQPIDDGPDHFDLRWFTPVTEVDLCGHATLATAHVLCETARVAPDATVRFATLSGELRARVLGERVEIDLPAAEYGEVDAPEGLAAALGADPVEVHESSAFLCVDLVEATELAILRPDLDALAEIDVDAVVVTALAQPDAPHDFVSRVFGPRVGIPEDPVTGSSHCLLGPLWGDRLGRSELVGFQVSARTGTVFVVLEDDRVRLSGHSVTVTRGELRI